MLAASDGPDQLHDPIKDEEEQLQELLRVVPAHPLVTFSRHLRSLLPDPAGGSRREPGRQPDHGTGLRCFSAARRSGWSGVAFLMSPHF